jgi:hypothetical protein
MKYQPGDWVRVLHWETLAAWYEYDPDTDPDVISGPGQYLFCTEMEKYAGIRRQVTALRISLLGNNVYVLSDTSNYAWEDWMLEPVLGKKNVKEVL